MRFELALEARLRADAQLAVLVGGQIKWERRVASLPAITMTIAADEREQHLKGFWRWRWTTVQFDIWGRDAAQTGPVENRLIALLTPSAEIEIEAVAVRFQRATIGAARGAGELQQGGGSARDEALRGDRYRRSRDIRFFHNG